MQVPKPEHQEKLKDYPRVLKHKRCPVCKNQFAPYLSTQKCCSPLCAVIQARSDRQKKENNILREKLKTLSDYLKETQVECNTYIRERDQYLPCISCNRMGKKRNAGHYRSVGAAPQLRFNDDNIHGQCEHCNSFKSGNVVEYRINLIRKIGAEKVEALENNNTPAKYTVEDAKRMKAEFKMKRKLLKGQLKID